MNVSDAVVRGRVPVLTRKSWDEASSKNGVRELMKETGFRYPGETESRKTGAPSDKCSGGWKMTTQRRVDVERNSWSPP